MITEIGAENGYCWEINGDCIEFKTPLLAGEYKIQSTILTLEIGTKLRQFYCLPMCDKWEIMAAANEIYRHELKNEMETSWKNATESPPKASAEQPERR